MTTTVAPITPAIAHAAQSFNVAARTNNFGVEALASRYFDLLCVGFSGSGFSAALDSVLDYRARGDRTFDVLKLAKVAKK
jgi:hypothetical protein